MQITGSIPANFAAVKRPSPQPVSSTEPRDYVVLVYSANNVSSLGANPQPVAGSYKLLPELKALAPMTADSNVSIVTQGYEKLETGQWVTRRYRIEGGACTDETQEVDGFRPIYEGHRHTGQVPDRGENVSLFSQQSVEDFLRDSLVDYPGAKNVVLVLNAHGAPTPNFGGEAIIGQQWQKVALEEVSVKSFGHALQNVAAETGARLSLLDINTCEMGKVENILELGEHADLVLASPQNEFVPKGHEYTAAFQDIVGACETLLADSSLSPRQLGEHIIDITTRKTTFVEHGVTENPIPTLDLYDTKVLPKLTGSLDKAGRRLSEMLKTEAGKGEVLGSLKKAFNFRQNVLDLRGFLGGIADPVAQELSQAVEEMTVASFAGKFRGVDYAQAGPIAVYMPGLPGADVAPILVPETGEDVKPLIEGLLKPTPEKGLRQFIVSQSDKLHTLHSNLEVSYPAMLEVLPNEGVSQALGRLTDLEGLLQLDRDLQALMSFGGQEKIDRVRQKIAGLVTPLQEALAEVDVPAWVAQFEAMGGSDLIARTARERALERVRSNALGPVKEYQELDNLPTGWKVFSEELTHLVVDQEWRPALDQAKGRPVEL